MVLKTGPQALRALRADKHLHTCANQKKYPHTPDHSSPDSPQRLETITLEKSDYFALEEKNLDLI